MDYAHSQEWNPVQPKTKEDPKPCLPVDVPEEFLGMTQDASGGG